MALDPASRCFWSRPLPEIMASLQAAPQGLSSSEAARRLESHGLNAVGGPARLHIFRKILRRLGEPLILMLIFAAAVSGATRDWASFGILLVILAGSILVDVLQEDHAEDAVEALKRAVAVRSEVRRDGAVVAVPVADIVPGDVIELAAGDLVPADGVVLSAQAVHVNQALLTGEPYPVEKRPGPCEEVAEAEAFNALFGGTAVISGKCTMLVTATGAANRFGGIAAALQSDRPPTAFERGLSSVGMLILRLTIFLTLFVLLAHIVFARPPLQSFLFAVALAVGLTPGLLPMVMTVTLARGALRMASRHVIVKRLAAIHDLGAMDVLCTDKTGTLTEARITLVGHPGADGRDNQRVLTLAALNSRYGAGGANALDAAIVASSQGLDLQKWRPLASVPFDFERRRMAILVAGETHPLLIVKGAPESILSRCTSIEGTDGRVVALDAHERARLTHVQEEKSRHGLRCLAVAWRHLENRAPTDKDETDLVFAGFCVFADPPKESAGPAIARLEAMGIRVKIVSGDSLAAVQHLVDTLHIPSRGSMTGDEIAGLTDAALAARVSRTDVFARVAPDQKTRIIRALRARGHNVGFIGDGINDAPAIRAADAGLSVESATDIARAAADLILLSSDLGVVADGVVEGRRTYANVIKYLRMGTSSNFGNMLSMAIASLFIPFLPLTPIQILLNNLIYDISEIGIPFDRVEARETARPHAWDMREFLRFTVVMGVLSSLFDIATFAILLKGFAVSAEVFRTAWFVESMATQILVIFLIRTALPAWRSRPHPVLVTTSLAALAGALLLALSPLGHIFGFTAVPLPLLAVIAGLVAAYLILAEWLKRHAMGHARRHARRAHRS